MMGRQLLLTAAVGAAPARIADVEWNNVKNILDIINVMTYDYYGAFDPITNHNAPLYPSAVGQPGFSCQESMDNLLALGVPANKLVMGVAFYGRSQMTTGTPGLHVQGNGQIDGTHFSADEGSPLYYNILPVMTDFDYHWDAVAQVPYLTGKTTNAFLSYDDEMSIEKKAQFINLRNLRGAIIWEISGDYLETSAGSGVIGQTPLIDKLNTTFCNGSTAIQSPTNLQVAIYPNPAQTQVGIFLKENIKGEWTVNLMDIQ
jgi:GH18 family chitinase